MKVTALLTTLILSAIVLMSIGSALEVQPILSSSTHCDIGGPWGWRSAQSVCPSGTSIWGKSCPEGSIPYQVNPTTVGCYYLGSNSLCKSAVPGISNADECCFYTCKPTSLIISDVSTIPTSPIQNNKSSQNVLINFNSSIYPIEIILSIANQNSPFSIIFDPIIKSNTNNFIFQIPSNLIDGIHILSANITDGYENYVSLDIADINVSEISISSNQTNQTNQSISLDIISPINKTYNSSNILLNISSENASLITYAINNLTNQSYSSPINLNLSDGNYDLIVTASNNQNSLTKSVSFSINTSIGNQTNGNQTNNTDLIPPSSISNLSASVTNQSITWNWNNPSDSDFSSNIIYLDGVNVINSSSNTYTALNLQSNSSHTILIHTKDISGNINNTDLINTATTLANSKNGNNGGNGGSNQKHTQFLPALIQDEVPTRATYDDYNQTLSLENVSKKSQINIPILIILLLLTFIILLTLFIILLRTK